MGEFSCSEITGETLPTQAVALGFIDSDQHLDAFFALAWLPNRVCLGDGEGGFGPCTDIDSAARDTENIAMGFLNGDSHLDLVTAESERLNRVCFGDGNGGFACDEIEDHLGVTRTVALGDLNGDKFLDVVFGGFNDGNRVCLGDGVGGFPPCSDFSHDLRGSNDSLQAVDKGLASLNTTDVALGFLDGDDHLDAVFSTQHPDPDRVCLGDGNGDFEVCRNVGLGDAVSSQDVALALVNEDQHLDAVFAGSNRNRMCLGRGLGRFEICTDINAEETGTFGVILGEFARTELFLDGFESGDTSAWTSP